MEGLPQEILINVEPISNWITTLGIWVTIIAGAIAISVALAKVLKMIRAGL